MNWGKHVFEAAILILAAILCALVSNAIASRERKLVVVSSLASPSRMAAGASPAAVPARAPAPTPSTASGGQPPTAVPPAAQPATAATDSGSPPSVTTDSGGPLSSTAPSATSKQTPLRLPIKSAKEVGATRKPITDPRQPIDRFPPHPDKAYTELHGDDVAWLHSKGALFLDARRTSVYEQGHIPGARPFSVWESDIDDKVNKLYAERPDPRQQNQPIVVYCSGGDCEDSHMLAQKLWGIGFNNAYVYKDGFPDWQKRGEAIHSGSAP